MKNTRRDFIKQTAALGILPFTLNPISNTFQPTTIFINSNMVYQYEFILEAIPIIIDTFQKIKSYNDEQDNNQRIMNIQQGVQVLLDKVNNIEKNVDQVLMQLNQLPERIRGIIQQENFGYSDYRVDTSI